MQECSVILQVLEIYANQRGYSPKIVQNWEIFVQKPITAKIIFRLQSQCIQLLSV